MLMLGQIITVLVGVVVTYRFEDLEHLKNDSNCVLTEMVSCICSLQLFASLV